MRKSRPGSFASAAALLFLAAVPRALPAAATGPSGGVGERLDQLEAQVRALQEEVRRLRARAEEESSRGETERKDLEGKVLVLTEAIENSRLGEVHERPGEAATHGLGPSASKVYQFGRPGVSIGGYGEMLYQSFSSERDDGSPSGENARLDFLRSVLYFGFNFSDRALFNSEIEFEHATTGEGDEARGEASVEFAYLDFRLSDAANLRAGMVLVPVGLVNETHEPTTYLGARRPDVEQSIIPTTWRENGAGVWGERGVLSYRAYVVAGLDASRFTAGEGWREGRQGGSNSLARDLALTARLDLRPVPGLLVGASGYLGDAGQGLRTPGGERVRARTTLWEAHLRYEWRGLEFRTLWVRTRLGDAERLDEALGLAGNESVGSRMEGWYAELGWDVLSALGTTQELVPFVRYAELDTQAEVPTGFARDPANDRRVLTLGLVWKPLPRVAVKVDWQDVDDAAGTGTDRVNFALGYDF